MDAVTYRDAAKAAAFDLGRALPDTTCTLVVCGPPPYRHALTAIVPDLVEAARVVEAMPGSIWTGTDGAWRGVTVGLVILGPPNAGYLAADDITWLRREHEDHPEVSAEHAAEAIRVVHRLELAGAL